MKERQRRREMTGQFDELAKLVSGCNVKDSRNKILQLVRSLGGSFVFNHGRCEN